MNAGVRTMIAKVIIGVVATISMVGCSSGGGGGANRTGTVVSVMDPYAIGCHVVSSDGSIARAVNVVNSPGRYIFDDKTGLPDMTATGCTDAATGVALPALQSPAPTTADNGVITPITTLIRAMMAADPSLTASSATTLVASNLGLSTSIDLLNYDALAVAETDAASALTVQSVSNQLVATMIMLEAATNNGAVVLNALVTAINTSDAAGAGSIVDLTSVTTLTTIVQNAGIRAAATSSIASAIAAVNTEIVNAANKLIPGSSNYAPSVGLQSVLITMSAATIVAENLSGDIAFAASVSGNTSALDADVPNIPSLVQDAESSVDPDGLTSVPVTVDNTTDQTGATGASG